MKGIILEKGEESYTHFRKIFKAISNVQKNYNWLITDCEAYPKSHGHFIRLAQSGRYAWISGEELTGIIRKDDFQWVWAVLSGFEKQYSLEEVLQYDLPYADGYRGFWQEPLSIQHPLASLEFVAWDSGCTLLISRDDQIAVDFGKAFPYSKDLSEYNRKRSDDIAEYEKRLSLNQPDGKS